MWSVSKSTHWQINTSCSCKILCSWGFSRKYLVWLETPWKQGWAGTVLPKVTDNPLHMERSLNLLFLSPAAAFPLIRQQINSLYPSSVERHFGRWAFPNDYLGQWEKHSEPNAAIPRRPSLSSQPVPPEFFLNGGIFGQVLQPHCKDTYNPRAPQENEGSCTP